jgi:hypothetical protein
MNYILSLCDNENPHECAMGDENDVTSHHDNTYVKIQKPYSDHIIIMADVNCHANLSSFFVQFYVQNLQILLTRVMNTMWVVFTIKESYVSLKQRLNDVRAGPGQALILMIQ